MSRLCTAGPVVCLIAGLLLLQHKPAGLVKGLGSKVHRHGVHIQILRACRQQMLVAGSEVHDSDCLKHTYNRQICSRHAKQACSAGLMPSRLWSMCMLTPCYSLPSGRCEERLPDPLPLGCP